MQALKQAVVLQPQAPASLRSLRMANALPPRLRQHASTPAGALEPQQPWHPGWHIPSGSVPSAHEQPASLRFDAAAQPRGFSSVEAQNQRPRQWQRPGSGSQAASLQQGRPWHDAPLSTMQCSGGEDDEAPRPRATPPALQPHGFPRQRESMSAGICLSPALPDSWDGRSEAAESEQVMTALQSSARDRRPTVTTKILQWSAADRWQMHCNVLAALYAKLDDSTQSHSDEFVSVQVWQLPPPTPSSVFASKRSTAVAYTSAHSTADVGNAPRSAADARSTADAYVSARSTADLGVAPQPAAGGGEPRRSADGPRREFAPQSNRDRLSRLSGGGASGEGSFGGAPRREFAPMPTPQRPLQRRPLGGAALEPHDHSNCHAMSCSGNPAPPSDGFGVSYHPQQQSSAACGRDQQPPAPQQPRFGNVMLTTPEADARWRQEADWRQQHHGMQQRQHAARQQEAAADYLANSQHAAQRGDGGSSSRCQSASAAAASQEPADTGEYGYAAIAWRRQAAAAVAAAAAEAAIAAAEAKRSASKDAAVQCGLLQPQRHPEQRQAQQLLPPCSGQQASPWCQPQQKLPTPGGGGGGDICASVGSCGSNGGSGRQHVVTPASLPARWQGLAKRRARTARAPGDGTESPSAAGTPGGNADSPSSIPCGTPNPCTVTPAQPRFPAALAAESEAQLSAMHPANHAAAGVASKPDAGSGHLPQSVGPQLVAFKLSRAGVEVSCKLQPATQEHLTCRLMPFLCINMTSACQ